MPIRRHPIARSNEDSPLESFPLDYALIARLRSVYQAVRKDDRQLATIFYGKLFAAQPDLRILFSADLDQQARKLVATLDAVVDSFERPTENARMLSDLGLRHVQYGAQPEHYGIVVELLAQSMEELLGPGAPVQGIEEWRTVLHLVGRQMIAANQRSSGQFSSGGPAGIESRSDGLL